MKRVVIRTPVRSATMVRLPDGTRGLHVIIRPRRLAQFKADLTPGALTWASDQPASEIPAKWQETHSYFGCPDDSRRPLRAIVEMPGRDVRVVRTRSGVLGMQVRVADAQLANLLAIWDQAAVIWTSDQPIGELPLPFRRLQWRFGLPARRVIRRSDDDDLPARRARRREAL